jgi:signal transduction histidine kinase
MAGIPINGWRGRRVSRSAGALRRTKKPGPAAAAEKGEQPVKHRRYDPIPERLLSKYALLLMLTGVAVNFGLNRLAALLGLPLYLDNVGSVLAAALGGPLPGMMAAFLSNLLISAADASNIYYGIFTMLIALAASIFSRAGRLRTIPGCLAAAGVFMLLGGAVGSLLGWFMNGGQIGGVSAPLATALYLRGFTAFWAQFTADMAVDFADKLLTMALVYLALCHLPVRVLDKLPLGYVYRTDPETLRKTLDEQAANCRRTTVHRRIVRLLAFALAILAVLTTALALWFYQRSQLELYLENASNVAQMTAQYVEGGKVDDWLAGRDMDSYRETKTKLAEVFRKTPRVEYLYVYEITEAGSRVVFDFDTPGTPADPVGSLVPLDPDFAPVREKLLAGEPVEPVSSHSQYGWLITAYAPIRGYDGKTVAYACVDVSTVAYLQSLLVYLLRLLTVETAVSLVMITAAIWYAQKKMVLPLRALVAQAVAFDRADPERWLADPAWTNRARIKTGDEIETLYRTMCRVEENVSRSVTQLRESERTLLQAAELRRQNRELEEAVRQADAANAAKTEFYSRMSHDMRTPMNGILGLAALSKEENDPQVLRENIRKIGQAGGYLLGLINDTLDLSKLESRKLELKPAPFYARDFLASLNDILRPSLEEKNITFEIENRGLSLDVYPLADELRLRQVFMNLLSNAIKFTPAGGAIWLTLESRGEDAQLARDRFILRDSGVGMSREFMENGLFRPFSQEHNSLTAQYAGSGLGLAIVKNLVELMHGRIAAESQPGEGTTFTLELDFPLVEPEQARREISAAHEPEPTAKLNGRMILLCEDNDLNAEIAARLLAHAGARTERAVNGMDAVERFSRAEPGRYDAILMDIRMPVMDGISAARRIRAMIRTDAQTVPIIAMTANAYLEDREQTKAAGMNAHLAKPIDTQALYRTLSALIP